VEVKAMEIVVDGIYENGKITLWEDVNIQSARIKVIFFGREKRERQDHSLLKDKVRLKTKNFKFNREEIYDRPCLH
jgi:predicted DNA-binding antitoxin AbrB/MazE fold protein